MSPGGESWEAGNRVESLAGMGQGEDWETKYKDVPVVQTHNNQVEKIAKV